MTNNWPHDNDSELDAFYSHPEHTAAWEVANLTYIFPPWKAYLAGTDIELKRGIRIHKKVAASLEAIFASLWETFGKSQEEIEKVDLHQLGGAYEFRVRRQSKRISNHARGIAIDIDPQDNQMGRGKAWDMDPRIVAAFEAEGWRWGKAFNDPMHFEAVNNGKASKPTMGLHYPGEWAKVATPHIKRFESFRANPYWDYGQWSNGYGQKCDERAAPITEEQASANLTAYLATLAPKVAALIKANLTDNQGAALLSFCYNLGDAALAHSTLLKKLNAGDYGKLVMGDDGKPYYTGAAGEFSKWVKSDGKTLPGLVKRRADERALFLS